MHANWKLVLAALRSGSSSFGQISKKAGLNIDAVGSACMAMGEVGAVKIEAKESESYALTGEGKKFLDEGFPEERAVAKLRAGGMAKLDGEERKIGIPWAVKNGWVKFGKSGPEVVGEPREYAMRKELAKVAGGNATAVSNELIKRGSVELKVRKNYSAEITAKGKQMLEGAGDEIGELTREVIVGNAWEKSKFSGYDVGATVSRSFAGRRHPLARLMLKIKTIFSEMGFEEMDGEIAESAFWNFDALFQPQDHPARDMADTFYLPGKACLPEKSLVEKIKKAHESGWHYEWSAKEAGRRVLRTHTTAVSARYVAAGKGKPSKYFSIGRVYRNEATDYKHLAEFHQVEGIVVWENATFRDLLGCLKTFYSKLGFEKIRFRPSYFPYTEPSLEVEVYFEEKKAWLELGGAGIFRPEVCIPLCGKYPVLAWGLSLERPLMLAKGINDMREIYRNDLGWLRNDKIGD
ncbi:MAG: phenylalanine--tRNA ligase subunit alpha [Candidatus Micrarchaeota archaeon]|nr:phenylalanine--tRNA ligase subunit alpha [Candidatus Micrarchaeota archaeon]